MYHFVIFARLKRDFFANLADGLGGDVLCRAKRPVPSSPCSGRSTASSKPATAPGRPRAPVGRPCGTWVSPKVSSISPNRNKISPKVIFVTLGVRELNDKLQQAFYSRTGNKLFPRWERNIPSLGIIRLHVVWWLSLNFSRKNLLGLESVLSYVSLG